MSLIITFSLTFQSVIPNLLHVIGKCTKNTKICNIKSISNLLNTDIAFDYYGTYSCRDIIIHNVLYDMTCLDYDV